MKHYSDYQNELIQYAKSIGIHYIGFTTAERFDALSVHLQSNQDKHFYSGLEEQNIEKRVNPKIHLPSAQSIISIAIAYPSKLHKAIEPSKSKRGMFSRSSWGMDYHTVLKKKLILLEQHLKDNLENAETLSMVDTGPLSDRAVAERAQLGFIGKNASLITPHHGSYVYLGQILTNIPFTHSQAESSSICGECQKCIDACPAQAIEAPYQINAQKCLSFLSQKKSSLRDDEKVKLGNRLYGCDTCQVVCPYNRGIAADYEEAFRPEIEEVMPELSSIHALTNRAFKERFGEMSGSWRGRTPIQRNAIIGAVYQKDQASIPAILEAALADPRAVIRETAVWAIGAWVVDVDEFSVEALGVLEKLEIQETDDSVREAIIRVRTNKI